MILKVNGKPVDRKEFDTKVVRVVSWYCRHFRTWIVQALNADGYQVGEAALAGNREDMEAAKDAMKEEHGIA